jgi:hypothetical protein
MKLIFTYPSPEKSLTDFYGTGDKEILSPVQLTLELYESQKKFWEDSQRKEYKPK